MDKLNQMLTFAKVAETGSFTEAAAQLGVGKSAVSMAISRLEQQLDTRLLHRSTRQLRLTEAGERYYQACLRITEEVALADEQIQLLRDEVSGRLRITCPVGFANRVLLQALDQFMAQYPAINLELILDDKTINLVEEGIDLAIRIAELENSELVAKPLIHAPMVLCAAPSFIEKHGSPSRIEDLSHLPWVLYSHTPEYLRHEHDGQVYQIHTKGRIKVNNEQARLQLTLAGHGLALMPAYEAWDAMQNGQLIEFKMEIPIPTIPVTALYQNRKFLPRKLTVFMEFLHDHLQQRPWQQQ